MVNDFFVGFACHAHTMNELELDQQTELELRRRNCPEEAQKLTGMVLDKLEKDLVGSGCGLEDVKLLIVFLSYRGEPAEKDTLICGQILRAIENRFKQHATSPLRLIGHTTGGEYENEDLMLKEISGVGYNGLSLLALVTNLPIGVGRTWGLRTAEKAREQGREMAHDAWVDFSQQTTSKEHLHMKKTLLVLTQGLKVDAPGHEHFLAKGIVNFMGNTREARIINVIGGSSGDGLAAKLFHQFYGRLKEHPRLKVLDGEAVCALIPNLSDVSIGLDMDAITRIGRQHTFHFNREKEPHFKYVRRIGNENSVTKYANTVYENEAKLSKERGLPLADQKVILEAISNSRKGRLILVLHPMLMKYAFAFPFGNYTCNAAVRVVGDDLEFMRPVRSYTPKMPGYFVIADYEKVPKGARRVYDMLRVDQAFSRNDATILVSCINRRLVELMAGCRSGTEAEILKDGLSSTQVIGFLASGELSFTHITQEPYFHAFSCWGLTLRSKTNGKKHKRAEPATIEVSKVLPGRISTGYRELDDLLFGGIPRDYAVILTSPSCDERDLLVRRFLEVGAKEGQVTFHIIAKATGTQKLAELFQSNYHFFVCNPEADSIVKSLPNVYKLKGVENLTDINIALTSALRKLGKPPKAPRRVCIEIVSDVLLQHHAVQTRKWLNALLPKFKSEGFTSMAVMDPEIHPPQEVRAILGMFDGEISIFKRATDKGLEKFLKIEKMTNQKYSDKELPLRREA